MTVLEHIRVLTGTTTGDVSDVAVAGLLTAHRIRFDNAVEWLTDTTARLCISGMVDAGSFGLFDADDVAVTGWTVELDGALTFATATTPARARTTAVGYSYDVYRTAADVVDALAVQLAREFDFTADGQDFKRSQQYAMLTQQAKALRSSGLVQSAVGGRTDEQDTTLVPIPTRRTARWR